jgi:hypothetical protein
MMERQYLVQHSQTEHVIPNKPSDIFPVLWGLVAKESPTLINPPRDARHVTPLAIAAPDFQFRTASELQSKFAIRSQYVLSLSFSYSLPLHLRIGYRELILYSPLLVLLQLSIHTR